MENIPLNLAFPNILRHILTPQYSFNVTFCNSLGFSIKLKNQKCLALLGVRSAQFTSRVGTFRSPRLLSLEPME